MRVAAKFIKQFQFNPFTLATHELYYPSISLESPRERATLLFLVATLASCGYKDKILLLKSARLFKSWTTYLVISSFLFVSVGSWGGYDIDRILFTVITSLELKV